MHDEPLTGFFIAAGCLRRLKMLKNLYWGHLTIKQGSKLLSNNWPLATPQINGKLGYKASPYFMIIFTQKFKFLVQIALENDRVELFFIWNDKTLYYYIIYSISSLYIEMFDCWDIKMALWTDFLL